MMTRLLALVLCVLCGQVALADDAFPLSRRGGLGDNLWTSAGIPGGIPYLTNIYTTLGTTATLAQINTAIGNCPTNQVVKLTSGTFNINGTILLTNNGVVLRGTTNGNGVPTTFLKCCEVYFQPSSFYLPNSTLGTFSQVSSRDVASGYTEGSTSITLSTAPNSDFAAGSVFVLDQDDDGVLVASDDNNLFRRTNQVDGVTKRSYCQTLYCTNISGNTLSFTPPLVGTYWSAGQNVQAYAWNNQHGPTRRRTGLEDVDVDATGCVSRYWTLKLLAGYQCWIRNVRVSVAYYSGDSSCGCGLMYSVNCEIKHNTIHDSAQKIPNHYGVQSGVSTACRIEDNYFTNVTGAIAGYSEVANSIGFNYGVGPYTNDGDDLWFIEYFMAHGGHSHHNIYEGNWIDGPIYADDNHHENSSFCGIVRNRLRGYYPGKTKNCYCFGIGEPDVANAHNDHPGYTILGNSLGTSGFHANYGSGSWSSKYLWYVSPYVSTNSDKPCITNNWNVVDNGIHSTESIGANTMLDSYTYISKPSWFGNLRWPPFGPQAYSNNGHTNIPAGYRVFFGADPFPTNLFITPAITSLTNGTCTNLHAWGRYPDGSTNELTTNGVTWSSSWPSLISVNQTNGVICGLVEGGASDITATYGSVTTSIRLTVGAGSDVFPPILLQIKGKACGDPFLPQTNAVIFFLVNEEATNILSLDAPFPNPPVASFTNASRSYYMSNYISSSDYAAWRAAWPVPTGVGTPFHIQSIDPSNNVMTFESQLAFPPAFPALCFLDSLDTIYDVANDPKPVGIVFGRMIVDH